jgi:predicted metal-dependent enzyme (double-stranded beta helix superfamily)
MHLVGKTTLYEGQVEIVSPWISDIHRVANAVSDKASLSIHVYGGNIGRIVRRVYDAETGCSREFVSGYANADAHHRGYALFTASAPGSEQA